MTARPGMLRLGGRPVPVIGTGRMYVCGVTPYDITHLGHAATFVWADLAVRVLQLTGVQVSVCRNVTDVDDVLTLAARRSGTPYDQHAAVGQYRFDQDMTALGVRPPAFEPRVHRHVEPVIALAAALIDLDAGYTRNGNVYLRAHGIGATAGLTSAAAGALAAEFGDEPEDPAKENVLDVAVWRASGPREPSWASPWGAGRPGWHAGCAAMALTTFGPAVDIHAGGADLRFPHHAYVARLAETVTGVRPYARAWLHAGTVRSAGHKMAKSTGNLVLVRDLLVDHPAARLRALLLDRRWNEPWEYTPALLDAAGARLEALREAAGRTGGEKAADVVRDALLDDLDVPRAIDIATEGGGAAARLVLSVLDPAV